MTAALPGPVAGRMAVGEIEVIALNDGVARLPQAFYRNLDFAAHPELLAADGRVHIPIGCFLIRAGGRTVLVDAGMGPVENEWARGGALPAALAAVGVAPADIDSVVCTHLHIDHIGWLWHDDRPWFPNATVRFGAADWEQLVEQAPDGDRGAAMMRALEAAGRLEPVDGDLVALAPGVTARHTPGHTLGHLAFVLASGDQRAYLLGDAVECPLQLAEPDLSVLSDIDPALAARTREALWREVEGSATLVGAAHFSDLRFGRVLPGEGRRFVAVDWSGPATH